MPEDLIRKYKKYRLKDFKEIIRALIAHLGDIEDLKGKTILELGPGSRQNLIRFLRNETGAASVLAAGKTITLMGKKSDEKPADTYLLPFLKSQKAKSIDIIYSRHVLEKNSIHPFLLIKHPAYWKAIRDNSINNPGSDFPASIANMQAVFNQAYRILKPGGIIISQIAKRKNSALTDAFLSRLKPRPKRVKTKELGRRSKIITVVK